MGNPKQTTIEINGKRYDARTGKLMTAATPMAAKKPIAKPVPAAKRRTVSDIARPSAPKSVHRPLERSQTLMRSAVKKPVPAPKTTKARTVSDFKVAKPAKTPAKPLTLTSNNDIARSKRAAAIKQSKLVSKFSDHKTIQRPLAPVAISQAEGAPVRPAPKLTPDSPINTMLERGLKNAKSHTETLKIKPKKLKKSSRRSKFAAVSAGALAALLLVGFISYQNIPNISMRYAAARAGVTASLPGYQPSGFALNNHIQYNPGQITVNFSSNTDDREFSITQRESTWNSDSLLSNYVSTKTDQVQKYEDKGRTIFLYEENNATWVNGGVWFDIKGDSQLNSDQLIRIATSM